MLFAIHLCIIGYLAYRSSYMPRYLGFLLAIAGAGYAIDRIGTLFVNGHSLDIANITFFGEVVLIFWLLICGRKVTLKTRTSNSPA